MDLFKKMFGLKGNEKDAQNNNKSMGKESGDEFRKPIWYDEESDDELFDNNKIVGFQVFTNPLEMQKHFEKQMQETIKTFGQLDGGFDDDSFLEKNVRDEYLKPGFEEGFLKNFNEKRPSMDVDLDGEIYADQLHTLLQRTSPELNKAVKDFQEKKSFSNEAPRQLTDEEKVWNAIHGNAIEDVPAAKSNNRYNPPINIPHRGTGGVFEGVSQGPKIFRQSIRIEAKRKPDGTYEIRRTVTDKDGNTKTTVSSDGKTETIIHDSGVNMQQNGGMKDATDGGGSKSIVDLGRGLYVSKDGYVLPRNLW